MTAGHWSIRMFILIQPCLTHARSRKILSHYALGVCVLSSSLPSRPKQMPQRAKPPPPPCLSILMGGIHCSYISTLENDWQANGKKLRSFARTSVCSANKQTTVNLPMPGPPLLSGNHTADKGSQLPLRPSSYLYDGHTHQPHTGKDFRNKR